MYSSEQSSPQSSLVDPPSSPGRARLRSLNYIRTYRQKSPSNSPGFAAGHGNSQMRHLESREGRSTSYIPPPKVVNSPKKSTKSTLDQKAAIETPAHVSCHESPRATSGWLPTVGGQSGVSRIATEPQATATASSTAVLSNNITSIEPSEISSAMPRNYQSPTKGSVYETTRQNAGEIDALDANPTVPTSTNKLNNPGMARQLPSIRFSVHQDPRALRPSLVFTPMLRILPSGKEVIKVGRYSEKDTQPPHAPNTPSSAPIGFKSKVVSRRHCEFWCYAGSWFIKDVKSSSGTFLNHIRLSAPGTESKPFPIHDGDIVQLGIDFKGGEEMIFRCVKIRLELNKGWQTGPSSFNMQSHKRLCELNSLGKVTSSRPSQDCSICLCAIAPCQPLFVAPCSHTWHYKCIRVIINGPHWPHFICPNCRRIADLEAELEETLPEELEVKLEKRLIEDRNTTGPSIRTSWSIDDQPRLEFPTGKNTLTETGRPESSGQAPFANKEYPSEMSAGSDYQQINLLAHRLDRFHLNKSPVSLGHPSMEAPKNSITPVKIVPRKSSEINQSESLVPHRFQSLNLASIRSDGAVPGTEVPLTPTNNLGPYVFDGDDSGVRTTNVSPISLINDTLPDEPTSNSVL